MNISFLLLIIFLISLVAILIGRKFGLKNTYKNREKLDLEQVMELFDEIKGSNLLIYKKAIQELAASIKLDVGLIRPHDNLADLFGRDSWELGEGQEKFEKWLLAYVGNLPEFGKITTVAELIKVIQLSSIKND